MLGFASSVKAARQSVAYRGVLSSCQASRKRRVTGALFLLDAKDHSCGAFSALV